MKTIKFTSPGADKTLIDQTPASSGIFGDYQFVINDDTQNCDWWVVLEGITEEQHANCPKNRTIFVSGEPESVKKYDSAFLAQFEYVVTCQTNLQHPRKILYHQLMPWYIGKSYDELNNKNKKNAKTKTLSIISSVKSSTKGHRERLKFIEKLTKHFGNEIDIFGRGFKEIEKKWDGIAPYRYTIVIENSFYPDYWTEKLADAYLAECYPLYYGCPNIGEYFAKDSITTIDIRKPDEAIRIIEKTIAEKNYELFLPKIQKAKQLVLDKYQIFSSLDKIISELEKKETETSAKTSIFLNPEKILKKSFFERLINKVLK